MENNMNPWSTNTNLQNLYGGLAGSTTQLPGTIGADGFTSDLSPDKSIWGQGKDMLGDFDFSGLVDGLTGLAGMWMNYDALKSQKASARDSHNANAKMYNNKLARARDVQNSISKKPTVDNRTHVAGSTV